MSEMTVDKEVWLPLQVMGGGCASSFTHREEIWGGPWSADPG